MSTTKCPIFGQFCTIAQCCAGDFTLAEKTSYKDARVCSNPLQHCCCRTELACRAGLRSCGRESFVACALAAACPPAQAVKIEVNHRRREQREHLAHDQPANN